MKRQPHTDARKHVDLTLIGLFERLLPEFLAIKERWAEQPR